jgi:hypothetical protein
MKSCIIILKIDGNKRQYLEGKCDHLDISPSKYLHPENIYFDTSASLMSMEKMFKLK